MTNPTDSILRSDVEKFFIEEIKKQHDIKSIFDKTGISNLIPRNIIKFCKFSIQELSQIESVNTEKVTRVELINQDGRAYTCYNACNVQISMQDDNRTLKVFLTYNK